MDESLAICGALLFWRCDLRATGEAQSGTDVDAAAHLHAGV